MKLVLRCRLVSTRIFTHTGSRYVTYIQRGGSAHLMKLMALSLLSYLNLGVACRLRKGGSFLPEGSLIEEDWRQG